MFKVTPETSRPHPQNLSAHLLNLARYTGIDTTKREQKGSHTGQMGIEIPQKRNRAKEKESSRGGRKSDDVEAKHLAGRTLAQPARTM